MIRPLAPLAAASLALFGASSAQAQAIPDIERSIIQGAQIDQAIERSRNQLEPRVTEGGEIDGEAGIFILKKEDIFYVGANGGLGWSSNPAKTSDDFGSSFFAELAVSTGVRTRLGGAVDFGIGATLSGTEYFKKFAPSNRNATANIALGIPIAGTPLYAGVAAFGGFNFDDHFNNSVGFYGATAHVSASIPLRKNIIVQPAIAATRQWSEISENDQTSVSARLAITAATGPLAVTVDGSVSRIWFDNFYEDVTFVVRNDWQYQGGASLSYRPAKNVIVSAGFNYVKRDSPFFLADYENVESGLSFSVLWRF